MRDDAQDLHARRRRLAEVLLAAVPDAGGGAPLERTACAIEHVLDPAATDAICAFLGHPSVCPHGRAIPLGPCCGSPAQPSEPAVVPLSGLRGGAEARVVFMVPRDVRRLVRLGSLGLAPGARLRVQQTSPTFVLRVGRTLFGLERALADEIYVQREGGR